MCVTGEVSREIYKWDTSMKVVPTVLATTGYIWANGRIYILVLNQEKYMKDIEHTLLIKTSASILEHKYKTIYTIRKLWWQLQSWT